MWVAGGGGGGSGGERCRQRPYICPFVPFPPSLSPSLILLLFLLSLHPFSPLSPLPAPLFPSRGGGRQPREQVSAYQPSGCSEVHVESGGATAKGTANLGGSRERWLLSEVWRDKKVFTKWMIRKGAPSRKKDILGKGSCVSKTHRTQNQPAH